MPLSTPDVLRANVVVRRQVRVRATPMAVALGGAACAGVIWGAPIMARMMTDSDFPFHLAAAEQFAATGQITMPHFLLQVLLGAALATPLFSSVQQAGLLFFCAVYAATGALVGGFIARGGTRTTTLVASVLLAAAVLAAAPILPREEPSLYLIGYFPANVYHNPTMLVAKPLLVLSLICGMLAVTRTERPTWRELTLLALPVALLGVAKPNYLACLVPAVGVAGIFNYWRKRAVSWPRIFAVCGAAVLTLSATFALYRSEELGFKTPVIFAPLQVIALYAPVDPLSIARSLFASLAFPIAVVALWPRAVWRDPALNLAWIGMLVGLFFSYFMAEAGTRLPDGNFIWTGQMAAFVLFVATAAFVRQHLTIAGTSALMFGRALAVGVVLVFHVESGFRHVGVKLEPIDWLNFWT